MSWQGAASPVLPAALEVSPERLASPSEDRSPLLESVGGPSPARSRSWQLTSHLLFAVADEVVAFKDAYQAAFPPAQSV